MESRKSSAEYTAFDNLVSRVIAVPREELKRREAEHQRQTRVHSDRDQKGQQAEAEKYLVKFSP